MLKKRLFMSFQKGLNSFVKKLIVVSVPTMSFVLI